MPLLLPMKRVSSSMLLNRSLFFMRVALSPRSTLSLHHQKERGRSLIAARLLLAYTISRKSPATCLPLEAYYAGENQPERYGIHTLSMLMTTLSCHGEYLSKALRKASTKAPTIKDALSILFSAPFSSTAPTTKTRSAPRLLRGVCG